MPTSPRRLPSRARVLVLLLAAATECHHASRSGSARPPVPVSAAEFVLQVVNHHWLDVDIYIVHDGQRTRVGTVTATTTQNFPVSTRLLGASRQIALVADAIGSRETVRSETLVIQPGQYVEWTLESSLRRSSVAVY